MRVFGIGFNKTGTTSLAEACSVLGIRSFHHRGLRLGPEEVRARIQRAVDANVHPFRYAARLRLFDAFFDVAGVVWNFEYFDRWHPGSKFILHTRDREAWLASREKHIEKNLRTGTSRWTTIDRDAWIAEWENHHAHVREYFRDRPGDLLTIDVAAGAGWEELCAFLGKPVPARDFPFANRAG